MASPETEDSECIRAKDEFEPWEGENSNTGSGSMGNHPEDPLLYETDSSHCETTSGLKKEENVNGNHEFSNDTPEAVDHFMTMGDSDNCSNSQLYDEQSGQNRSEGNYDNVAIPSKSCSVRKIKPVHHPSLKLQTPIAYRKDSDVSRIPIKKDGMATCLYCGAFGVKHAFYTRERNYCSLVCRKTHERLLERTSGNTTPLKETNGSSPISEQTILKVPFPILKPDMLKDNNNSPDRSEQFNTTDNDDNELSDDEQSDLPEMEEIKRHKFAVVPNTYEWSTMLSDAGFIAAAVTCFKHAPISDSWEFTIGMKVEVENKDTHNVSVMFPDSFWVATVIKICGYKALMRYEGFIQDSSKDFWINLCGEHINPVGWCASIGKPLIPPKSITSGVNDWKQFLMKRLTGARTLPNNFHKKVTSSLKSRFKHGTQLEVVDKNCLSQVRMATVIKIHGKRLHLMYDNAPDDDMGFWCHEDSPLIHHVGWATAVGHKIAASKEYKEKCDQMLLDEHDSTFNMFVSIPDIPICDDYFREGMRMEAIDPLNLSAICAATIMKVLSDDYIMIRIDCYDLEESRSWFCYHASSPYLFPVGFCELNNIKLKPPKGYGVENFIWADYLKENKAVAVPPALFNIDIPNHGFKVGMHLESADLMDPRLICVGMISRVVGRLLKIHFDGWEEEYDQWLDCNSPDIYPVGWCELVGHKLEGPREILYPSPKKPVKKRKRRMKKPTPLTTGNKRIKPNINHETRRTIQDRLDSTPDNSPHVPEVSSSDETLHSSLEMDHHISMDTPPPFLNKLSNTSETKSTPSPKPKIATQSVVPEKQIMENPITSSSMIIPRLVEKTDSKDYVDVTPDQWSVYDVAQFLRVNDCGAYCNSFCDSKVNGQSLYTLTKDQIIALTGMKVGPSLKIFDLIQQLKTRVSAAQARLKASLRMMRSV